MIPLSQPTPSDPKQRRVLFAIAIGYLALWATLAIVFFAKEPSHTSEAPKGIRQPASIHLQKADSNILHFLKKRDNREALDQLLEDHLAELMREIQYYHFQMESASEVEAAYIQRTIEWLFEQKYQMEIFQNRLRAATQEDQQALQDEIYQWLRSYKEGKKVS